MVDSRDDRIRFSQAVDYLDQGRADLVGEERIEGYIAAGLLERGDDGRLRLTPEGLRQHQAAQGERFSDG